MNDNCNRNNNNDERINNNGNDIPSIISINLFHVIRAYVIDIFKKCDI